MFLETHYEALTQGKNSKPRSYFLERDTFVFACDFFMGCRREISYEKIRSKRCCAFQRLCSYPAAVTESSRTFSPSAGGTRYCQAQRCTFTSPASFQTRSATGSLMVFAAVRPQNVTANSLPKKKKKKRIHPQKHHVICTRHTFHSYF